MTEPFASSDILRMRVALAAKAYRTGTVRLVRRDLSACTHVVATRAGLYGMALDGAPPVPIAPGFPYGITVDGGCIYVFEACDRPRAATRRGRIVRLTMRDGVIADATVIAAGLDNGCHQIDVIDGLLCIVDTYRQAIVRMTLDGTPIDEVRPFPAADQWDWAGGYLHINSIHASGDSIFVVLHRGGTATGHRSELEVLDRGWTVRDRIPLAGTGCHNVVAMPGGRMLCCASLEGELIDTDGMRVAIGATMTRGLSVDAHTIAVGGSALRIRGDRDASRGSVTWLDHAFGRLGHVDMPAPVNEIRRIDGADMSLSAAACR